jgi:hypothetical protein
MRRILVVLVLVLTSGLFATSSAQAGNWEETLLDPVPARIEPGVTYTFGYWVLQHGSYPFMGGDLGPTALVATEKGGDSVEFAGTAARTEGHYFAEVVFPHKGTWTIGSKHEVIMADPLVATVTVPGAVAIAPSEMTERAPYEWGTVRPSFPPSDAGAALVGPETSAAAPATAAVAPKSQSSVDKPAGSLPWSLVALGGVATIGFAVWLARRFARANRG